MKRKKATVRNPLPKITRIYQEIISRPSNMIWSELDKTQLFIHTQINCSCRIKLVRMFKVDGNASGNMSRNDTDISAVRSLIYYAFISNGNNI